MLGSPCGDGGPASLPADGPGVGVGNPVHLGSGNKYQRDVDMPALPGALGLELVRHYNALYARIGAFGSGWTLSYDTRVYRVGGRVQIVQADGARLDFHEDAAASGHCVAADPAHGQVQVLDDGGFVWTWPVGRVLEFDAAGRLIAVVAADGGRLTLARGRIPGQPAYGHVVRATDPVGRTMRLVYEGVPGRVVRVETPAGTIAYDYDADGHLSAARYPDGHARVYRYDVGLAATGTAALTEIAARRPDGGQVVLGRWHYDAGGRVSATYAGAPGDASTRMDILYGAAVAVPPAAGGREGAARDGPSARKAPQTHDVTAEVASATGERTQFRLSATGARFQLREARGAGCEGCAAVGAYAHAVASSGGVQALSTGDPGVDPAHPRHGKRHATGDAPAPDAIDVVDWSEHDGQRRPRRVERSSVVAGKRHALVFEWSDVAGPRGPVLLPTVIREEGWRPLVSGPLEPQGALAADGTAEPIAREWRLDWAWHEGAMRLAGVRSDEAIAPVTAGPGEAAAANADAIAWPGLRSVRDDFGQVLAWHSDATGWETRHYDARGRLAERRFANGDAWHYEHDDAGRLTRWGSRDQETRLAWDGAWPVRIDHPQELERRAHDADGRLIAREVRRPASGVRRLAYEESFERDAAGRTRRHRLPEGGELHYRWGAGARLRSIDWLDAAGRLHRVLRAPRQGAGHELGNGVRMRPVLDQGRLVAMVHARDERLLLAQAWSYDAHGRIAGERLRVAGDGGAEHLAYLYDGEGRLAAHASRAVTARPAASGASVDRFGHAAPARQTSSTPFDSRSGEATQGVRARQALQAPAPARTRAYRWHGNGALLDAGPLAGAAPPTARIERDASGLPRRIGPRDLRYDASRRLAEVREDGQILARYRHNAFGERIWREDGNGAQDYLYVDQRVAAEWRDDPEHGAGVTRRFIHANGVLVAMIDYARPQPLLAPAGGVASRQGIEEMSVQIGGARREGGPATYGPYELAARHKLHLDGYWTRLMARLAHRPDRPSLVPTISGLPPRLVATAPAAQLLFVHADAVGLPRVVTDAAGEVRWRATFTPFGKLTHARGDLAADPGLRLPGQLADPATGWHDNYLRTYDPGAGHYLEPDPLGPASLVPATGRDARIVLETSPFGYARHQPRQHADPLGLVLFAFDGTREDLSTRTNVYHFALSYRDLGAVDRGLDDLYYVPGPGNPDMPDLDAAIASSSDVILATQWSNLLAHLTDAAAHPERTPLDIIAYSRGAALARHFANQLADSVRQGRFWDWQDGVGAVTACVELRFMGLFDSVARLGLLGRRDKDYDFTVAPDWSLVAHAVSAHEQRRLFSLLSLTDAEGRLPANAIELPFIGAHADVGGGITVRGDADEDDRHDLSDIALAWMSAMAARAGLDMLAPQPAQQVVTDPVLHDSRGLAERSAERHAALIAHSLGLGDDWRSQPALPYPDRMVQAADGSLIVDRQVSHPSLGLAARVELEAFIERMDGWLEGSSQVVGTVDLTGYEAWLARRTETELP